MRITLITEGGRNIGFGHLSRCLSLCQAFEARDAKTEFIINGDKSVFFLLKKKKCVLFNWLREKRRLFEYLKDVDIAIVDSYLADQYFYKRISEIVRLGVYIDDNKRINYPKGIVVNSLICAESFRYPRNCGVEYLLGSQYMPLRREFWDLPEKSVSQKIRSILVTFGGNDASNFTPKVLKLLSDEFPQLSRNILTGKTFHNVARIMRSCDVAISAGGQTLSELARAGVPAVAVLAAENQRENIRGWQKKGVIEYAGSWKEKDIFRNITKALGVLKTQRSRQERIKSARKVVDGMGAIRIINHCLKVFLTGMLIMRRAEHKDMHTIFELVNEKAVRGNSFSHKKIELRKHRVWFLDKLDDPECLFLIAEAGHDFIGQARFDIKNNEAIISVSIKQGFTGLGLGKEIISRAVVYLEEHIQRVRIVKAYIREGNISSILSFQQVGFRFLKKTRIKNQKAAEYIYYLKREINEA